MSLPRPLVGDTMVVSAYGSPSQEFQVAHTNGQFIFVGNYRFHVRDDRVNDNEWSYNGVRFVLKPHNNEGQA